MTAIWKQYGKLITGLLGVIITALATNYGTTAWYQVVVAVATAVGVYYAPHTVAPVVPPTPPTPPTPPIAPVPPVPPAPPVP